MSNADPRPVLYLDYDGVLHPALGFNAYAQFAHLPILESILSQFSDVRIVLSTSWTRQVGIEHAKGQIGGPAARVIGSTYEDQAPGQASYPFEIRGERILADVVRRGIADAHWIALDDDTKGWPHTHAVNLIPAGADGLADPQVQRRLREALAAIVAASTRQPK